MYETEGPQLATCHQSADRSADRRAHDHTVKIGVLRQITVSRLCLPQIAPRLGFPLDCECISTAETGTGASGFGQRIQDSLATPGQRSALALEAR